MSKRRNWDVLGFCSCTVKGCIRGELLVDLPGAVRDGIRQKVPGYKIHGNVDKKGKNHQPVLDEQEEKN